jgi:hypothetical protein
MNVMLFLQGCPGLLEFSPECLHLSGMQNLHPTECSLSQPNLLSLSILESLKLVNSDPTVDDNPSQGNHFLGHNLHRETLARENITGIRKETKQARIQCGE